MKLVKSVMKMWTLLFLLSLSIQWSGAQINKIRRPFDNGHGFDVRLAVPGDPGNDYPTLNNIPKTSFSCSGKEPGYYADTETNCQVFRVCTFGSTYGFQSFLCPNGTLFNQAVFVCDWWMNVKCEKSNELFKYKNDVGKLKLGPHFMRDIKKMITHPMRNPYDKTFIKNNLIIMQEYTPPNGQLYNSISENYSERNTNTIFSQLKETSQNSLPNLYSHYNISLEATTPRIQYYSNYNIYPPINNNVDFFQQQKQRSYSQANILNKPRKLSTDFYNGQTSPTTAKNILSYTKNFQFLRPTQIYQKSLEHEKYINSLNPQANIQREQLVNKKQFHKPEQTKLGAQNSKKQLNQHIAQDKELYSSKSNQIRFSKDTSNQKEIKTKPNLDLVFSFLADSINAAKKYSNIATQNIALPTSKQSRNFNDDELGSISSKVSQLTSAQYANNKLSENTNTKNDSTKYLQLQEANQVIKPTQQTTYKKLSTPASYRQTNAEPIYSGQLYQLPVPEVTKQFYNLPIQTNAKYRFSNNELANTLQNGRYQNAKQNRQTSTKNDIIKSKKISPDSLKPSSNQIQERNDQGITANTFLDNIYLPKDGITAQIHDNTIGTIPHPLNEDKIIKYKKNHIYYIYTHLNNNNNASDIQENDIINSKLSSQTGKQPNLVSYQLIPSVGYKVDNKKEKQNLLNTLQIGEFGYPKQIVSNTHSNQRQDIVADVDYIVNHPASGKGLYNGPSSYYAPQASVGSLELKQNIQTNYATNANLEKFDTNESTGYPKIRPSKEFLF